MSALLAGFGKVELPVPAGVELVGYPNREGPATGVRDPLHARALVLDDGEGGRVALCALELCYAMEDVAAAARERVARRGLVPADALFVAATHTHSGPYDADPAAFPDGLDALVEQAVAQASERLQPARIGAGMGTVHGHAINRRRLEDPVDPALLVLRVDALDGRPLGLVHAFGCHPVVLGPDNRLVSADWPGEACRRLEAELGGAITLFLQGASGDVNPLTDGVRARLGEGRAVVSTARLDDYYGPDAPPWEIGDRIGGIDAELELLGRAVAEETLRVRRGIETGTGGAVWTRQVAVPVGDGSPTTASTALAVGYHEPRVAPGTPLEVMLVGLDGPGLVLVGMPGEPFADTGVALRRALRAAGARRPFAIGQANGRRAYLPPAHAFADGGYEVEWAQTNGFPEALQDDVCTAVLAALRQRNGAAA